MPPFPLSRNLRQEEGSLAILCWGLFTVCGNGRLAKLNANNPGAIADSRWWFKADIAGVKRRSACVLCIRGRAASRAPLPDEP